MLLTPQELTDLTGYQKPSAQMRWLTAQEIPFLVGGDGRPKVLRDTLTARLGSSLATGSRRPEPQLHLSGPRARKKRQSPLRLWRESQQPAKLPTHKDHTTLAGSAS